MTSASFTSSRLSEISMRPPFFRASAKAASRMAGSTSRQSFSGPMAVKRMPILAAPIIQA